MDAQPGTSATTEDRSAAPGGWIDAARTSERDDEQVFVDLYPALRRFASTIGNHGDDPDDLVHDALVRVLRGGPLQRLDDPLPYLRRVVLHLAIDRARHARRAGDRSPLIATSDRHVDDYPSDLAFLDSLAPADRALLHLVDIEGVPIAAAAAGLGIRGPAARARVMRARRRLRNAILEGEAP